MPSPIPDKVAPAPAAELALSAPLAVPASAKVPAVRAPTLAAAPEQRVARKRPWLWALGAVLVLAVGGGFYWWQPWAAKVPLVVVETVAPAPLSRVLAVNGRIAALHPVEVRATISGTVLEVLKAEGDRVANGEVIARIDAVGQQAAVRQALAALDVGTVAQVQAMADADRLRALGGNVTRNALEDATRKLQSARQEIDRLAAFFDQAQIQLAKYTITAPIAGTVLIRGVEPGQSAEATTILFTLADQSPLVVQAEVDETYAAQIAVGQKAVLQMAGETATRPGHVSFVSPRVNPDTGALVVKITPDPAISAPVGLTVTANIVVDEKASGFTAPRSAILTEAEATAAYVIVDGKAKRRVVSVVPWPAVRLEVTEGLTEGDVLIVDPTGLTDGQAVKIAKP